MSAAETLREARTVGIQLRVEGCYLALQADTPPSAALLERLARHKLEIVALLRPGSDSWSAEDWQTYFDERAAIIALNGGLPRPVAEARAFKCSVSEWLDRNFERSPPGRCLACSGADYTNDVLLPHGVAVTGHAWLHSRCWPAWYAGQKAKAVAALNAMGIQSPLKFPNDFGKNGGA
jgi:hypothetical protein